MSDDATAEQIRILRADLRDDLGEIKAALAALLPREVWAAHRDADVHRLAALETAVAALSARYQAELAALEAKHTVAIKELRDEFEKAEEEKAGRRRWMIGGPVLSIVAMIVSIWLALRK